MPLTKVPMNLVGDESLWGSPYEVMQAGLSAFGHNEVNTIEANNLYFDGTNWRYIAAGFASLIAQSGGETLFYSVPSGTANEIATLNNPAFKIDTSGRALAINTQGVGYGTGSGGSVTQATSKSTSVTLNKPNGQIVMSASTLTAGTTATFFLLNSLITPTDNVVMTANFASGPYQAWVYAVESGQCRVAVRNSSAVSLSDSVVLNFAVIKGSAS